MLPLGAFNGMQDLFKQPAVKRSMPAIIALLTLMIFGAIYLWMQAPPWRNILPGLGESDRQAALEALKTGRFDAKVDPETGNLQVPAARYHEARMLLASQGLPKGAVAGGIDSLKDQSAMTTSQFMEQVRYNSAIEQELARSVMTISTIRTARVHLAMPRQSPFIRERIAPKASVVVTPHQGRMVSPAQVKAITQLISSSVPTTCVSVSRLADSSRSAMVRNELASVAPSRMSTTIAARLILAALSARSAKVGISSSGRLSTA